MDTPNAFVGRTTILKAEEVAVILGKTAELWKQLVDWIAEQEVTVQEWKSTSLKYRWSLRLKLKRRTIVYLGPCDGCFRVAFVLGDGAVAAARQKAAHTAPAGQKSDTTAMAERRAT